MRKRIALIVTLALATRSGANVVETPFTVTAPFLDVYQRLKDGPLIPDFPVALGDVKAIEQDASFEYTQKLIWVNAEGHPVAFNWTWRLGTAIEAIGANYPVSTNTGYVAMGVGGSTTREFVVSASDSVAIDVSYWKYDLSLHGSRPRQVQVGGIGYNVYRDDLDDTLYIQETMSDVSYHGVVRYTFDPLFVKGDINGDGGVSGADIDLLLRSASNATTVDTLRFDVNGYGQINSVPGGVDSGVDELVGNVLHTHIGDANLDTAVKFSDLVILAQHYGMTSNARWGDGDFNGDSAVDFNDLVPLAQNYNAGSARFASDWALARAVVPEPTLASGLLLMALLRRRRPEAR